jgi:hypothetical protein
MENAHAHPAGLENNLDGEYSFIKIKYLPTNSKPFIQPMDKQLIWNFK